jgi:competence protein ComEC
VGIVWLAVAWLTGVGLALTYGRPELSPVFFTIGTAAFVGVIVARGNQNRRLIFACGMVAAFGAGRALIYPNAPTSDQIGAYNDRGVIEFTGVVDDYPDVRDNAINLRIRAETLDQAGKSTPIGGYILVQVDRSTDVRYGDRLQIRGAAQTPARFDTFSYRDYLARSGVYSVLYRPIVRRLARDQGNPLLAASFNLRERLYTQFNQWLPAPQSALFNGILLGLDNDLPQDIKRAFQDTGASHIIAISGANVAVVAGILLALLGRVRPRWVATVIIIVGIGWYALFVGASSAVVRAAFAVGLTVFAERTGRRSLGLASLAFTVFIQTLVNPLLIFDASLILSSLGTLGILIYLPILQRVTRRFMRRIEQRTLRRALSVLLEAVLTTIAAQAVVTPAILALFGRNSIVSLPVNALIVPAQAPVMGLGLLAAAFALVFPPLGQLFAWAAMIPVSYSLWVVRGVGSLPGVASAAQIEPGAIILYYAALFGGTWYFTRPAERRKRKTPLLSRLSFPMVGSGMATVAILLWAMIGARPDGRLHVHFLDVGASSAALIQTPGGATILIDGGENPSRLRTALGDRLPFYARTLDLHILTETRRSSLAALPPLLDRYTIRMALAGRVQDSGNGAAAYREAFTGEWLTTQDEQTIHTEDGLTLQFIHTGEDAALALLLVYKNARFLFAPNLDAEQLEALHARNLAATVLQLSPRAQDDYTPALIQPFAPQLIVMETEAGQRYPVMNSETAEFFRKNGLHLTHERGGLHLATDGNTLSVQPAR